MTRFLRLVRKDGINAAIWEQYTESSRTNTSKMTSTFYERTSTSSTSKLTSAFSIRSSTSSTLKTTSTFSELHRTTSSLSRSFETSRSLLTTRSISRFFNDPRQIVYVQIQTSTFFKSSWKSSTFRLKLRRSPNRAVNVLFDRVSIQTFTNYVIRSRSTSSIRSLASTSCVR